MTYSLIVDIGNSQVEIGLFSKDSLVDKVRFDTHKLGEEYGDKLLRGLVDKLHVSPNEIEGGMIFSVVPHITRLVQIVIKGETGASLDIFNPESVLNELKSNIDNPKEVGQDLIADILGAIHYYGYPVVVSDLGTVTKNIIIDKDGVFQGVSFFPGVRLNANALASQTAQLPKLNKISKPKDFYGKNTVDAMTSGIYYCHVAAIKRFMDKADEAFGYKFTKVITGGYSNIFNEDFEDNKYVVDPNLVLKGMYLIYKNQK